MKQRVITAFALILLLLSGCGGNPGTDDDDDKKGGVVDEGPIEQTSDEEPGDEVIGATTQTGQNVLDAIAAGTVVVEQVVATDYTNETGGQMLVDLTNPGAEKIYVTIPCGLVFIPGVSTYQQMMVIQSATVEIEPGVTVTIDVYVVCINGDLAWPTAGAAYTISGYVENTDMRALADCVCEQPIDYESITAVYNMTSVQSAAWMIEDPETASALAEYAEMAGGLAVAFGQAAGGDEGAEAMSGSMDQMLAAMTTGAQAILDACMIQPQQ